MSPSVLYRVASALLVLFALAHQLGFRQVDPRWGVDSALGVLKATQVHVQGVTRSLVALCLLLAAWSAARA